MQRVLMKFGICYLVVLDYGTSFKGDFIATCQSLNLNYVILAKRNHKRFTFDHFRCFLNKSVTIISEERDTNNISVSTGIATGYAWIGVPIDDINTLHSIPGIGQEINFPIAINLNNFH